MTADNELGLEETIRSGEHNGMSFPQLAACVTRLAGLAPDDAPGWVRYWHMTYQQALGEAQLAQAEAQDPDFNPDVADAIRQHGQYARLVRDLFLDALI